MESINIALNYKDEVLNLLKDITLILYGSSVYGCNSSDLDVCMISDTSLNKEDFDKLKNLTKEFHLKNNLKIDEEVPYENKLIYTNLFIEDALVNIPFKKENNRYIIDRINKSKEFLSSDLMKKRLILNILTTKNMVLNGNSSLIDDYSKKAWEQILKVVISYCHLNNFSISELLDCLYQNPYTKEEGEMYLGYKTNLNDKKIYLEEKVTEQLEELEKDKKIEKTLKKIYTPNKSWLV